MQLLFILKLAMLNLFTKRLRTGLTIGGIALSVGVMVFLMGLGTGLRQIVTSEIAKTDSQTAISVSSKRSKQLKLDQAAFSRLKSISGVSDLEQMVGLSGRLIYHGISLDLPIYAVTPGYLTTTPLEITQGQPFTIQTQQDFPVLVSQVALKALGISKPSEAIGKKMDIQVNITQDYAVNQVEEMKTIEHPGYTVEGVINKGNMPVAYIPLEYIEQQGVSAVAEVKLVVSNPDKIAAVRETVEQLGFQTSSIHDTIEQANRIFSVIQTILIIFGAITLIVAVFGTLNTITMALVEQTRQVGFLRILGVHKRDVGRLFIIQSVLLSFLGVLGGVILGVVIGGVVNGIIWYIAERNGVIGLSLYQTPILPIILLLISSIGLGWMLGIGPSQRAIRMQPLEALRM